MKVLVACEFSGVVRDAFLAKGHDAWSCDLLPTESPGQHIQDDVLNHLKEGWDLMIAHPPCTYLCASGNAWVNRRPEWKPQRVKALEFIRILLDAPIKRIALENPVGVISTQIRKPDQILRAWQFGHPYTKEICLWLKNLPKLTPTVIDKPKNLKPFDFWSTKRFTQNGGNKRAITFQGVSNEMAEQWGCA